MQNATLNKGLRAMSTCMQNPDATARIIYTTTKLIRQNGPDMHTIRSKASDWNARAEEPVRPYNEFIGAGHVLN